MPITCVTASPCSTLALSGDKGGGLSLWSLSSGAQLAAAQGDDSRRSLTAACWLQDAAQTSAPALLLVTAQQGCSAAQVWQAEGRPGGLQLCGELSAGDSRRVAALQAAGALLAVGCSDGTTLLWRYDNGNFTQQALLAAPELTAPIAVLSFSRNAALLAAATGVSGGEAAAAFHVPSRQQVMRHQALCALPVLLLWKEPGTEMYALLKDGSHLSFGLPLHQLSMPQALQPGRQQQRSLQQSHQGDEKRQKKVVRFAVAEPPTACAAGSAASQPGARLWAPQPIPCAAHHPPSQLQGNSGSSVVASGCRADLPELPAHPLLRGLSGQINCSTNRNSFQESACLRSTVSAYCGNDCSSTKRGDLAAYTSTVNPLFTTQLRAELPRAAGAPPAPPVCRSDAAPALRSCRGTQPPQPPPAHRRQPLYPVLDLRALQGLPAAVTAAVGKPMVPQQPTTAAGKLPILQQPQLPPAASVVPAGDYLASEQPAALDNAAAKQAAAVEQPAEDFGAKTERLSEISLAGGAAADSTAGTGQQEQQGKHCRASLQQQQRQEGSAEAEEAPRQHLPPAPMQRQQDALPPCKPEPSSDHAREQRCGGNSVTMPPTPPVDRASGCVAAPAGLTDHCSPKVAAAVSPEEPSGQASLPERASAGAEVAAHGIEPKGAVVLHTSAADPSTSPSHELRLTADRAPQAAPPEAQQARPGDLQPRSMRSAAAAPQQARPNSLLTRRCAAGSEQQCAALAVQLEEVNDEADAAGAKRPQQLHRPQQPQQRVDKPQQTLGMGAAECGAACRQQNLVEEQPCLTQDVVSATTPALLAAVAPATLCLSFQAAASVVAAPKGCAFGVGSDEDLSGGSDGDGGAISAARQACSGGQACCFGLVGPAPTHGCLQEAAGDEEAPCDRSQPAAASVHRRLLTHLPAPVSLRCRNAGAALASLRPAAELPPAVTSTRPDSSGTCRPLSAQSADTVLPGPAFQLPSTKPGSGRIVPALTPAQVQAARRRAATAATTLPRSARVFSNLPPLDSSAAGQAALRSSGKKEAGLAGSERKQPDVRRAAQQQQQPQPYLEQLWVPPAERVRRQHQAAAAAAPPLMPTLPCGRQLVAQLLGLWPS